MLKALLFDLDGVLLDSASLMLHAFDATLKLCGIECEERRIREILHLAPQDVFRALGADATAEQIYDRIYSEAMEASVPWVPHAEAMLVRLFGAGVSLGIVTSQDRHRVERVLASTPIRNCFGAVITANDVNGRKKPDPYPIQLALERLNVNPVDCGYVGDMPSDIEAARYAKVWSIAVPWGLATSPDLEACHPDLILAQPSDILLIPRLLGNGRGGRCPTPRELLRNDAK